MKAYYHNKAIAQIFKTARQVAWAQMMQDMNTKRLIAQQRAKEMQVNESLKDTQGLLQMNR